MHKWTRLRYRFDVPRWKFDTPKWDLTEKRDGLLSANTLRQRWCDSEGGRGNPQRTSVTGWTQWTRFQHLGLVFNVQVTRPVRPWCHNLACMVLVLLCHLTTRSFQIPFAPCGVFFLFFFWVLQLPPTMQRLRDECGIMWSTGAHSRTPHDPHLA